RHGLRKSTTLWDLVLQQAEAGPCAGVSSALQKKSLSAAEERDGTRTHAESEYGDAAVSHYAEQPVGLSSDDRFQKCSHRHRQFRQLRRHQTALSGPGDVQEGRAASLRDSRCALGFADQGCGP